MSLTSGFADRIKTMPDDELLAILAKHEDYLPDAVALARDEKTRRGLSDEQLVVAEVKAAEIDDEVARRAGIPLSSGMKLSCFLFPLNFWMIYAGVAYSGTGYKRRADDISLWMGCGFFFYFFLAIVLSLVIPGK